MSTKQKTKTTKRNTTTKRSNNKSKRTSTTDKQPVQHSAEYTPAIQALLDNARPAMIPASAIVFSPFNYRKKYSSVRFEELVESIRQHGIISPLLVRPLGDNQYELVVGSRRLSASRVAGQTEVPVRIAEPTDEQVREIQLIENLHREDPHPLHDAQAIMWLLDQGHSIDEVAARLCRSNSFIYQRMKLSTLIDPFGEMFLADVINLTQAIELAALDPQSQQAFYAEHCSDWLTTEDFEIGDLSWELNRYRNDLTNAPFDTTDAALLPEAGACTSCPDNSATLVTLFPEMADTAVCSNRTCYNQKCDALLSLQLLGAIAEHQPVAILLDYYVDRNLVEKLNAPALQALPRYSSHEYDEIDTPIMPDREDYVFEEADEPFDAEGYQDAMNEYTTELEEFNELMEAGKLQKGLLLKHNRCKIVYFMAAEARTDSRHNKPVATTAKEVQAAIKTGTATPELLQGEINRINQREERAQAIDSEKIQLELHQQFDKGVTDTFYNELTEADHIAARYLIYLSLSLVSRMELHKTFYGEDYYSHETDDICQKLMALDDRGFAFLIRRALLDQDRSKIPHTNPAKLLIDTATQAGVNVVAIQQAQQDKADTRQERLRERIHALEQKIDQLQRLAANQSAA